MSGLTIRGDLTASQKAAARWLHNRGGEGMFNRHQVLLARGELAGVMRATWNALAKADPPCIVFSPCRKRVSLTEAGRVVAMTCLKEAATVEDEWE